MARQPRRQVCPLCGLDDSDYVGWQVEAPGLWRFTCSNPTHDPSFAWLTTGLGPLDTSGYEGLSNELGIYEDLLGCLHAGEPFAEYGVIEYRYATTNSIAYRRLVSLFNHTALQRPLQYSTSAFIGAALGKLYREGLLQRVLAPASGYWSYNGKLNAYALTPASTSGKVLTWATFATDLGLDPLEWPSVLFG